MYTLTNREMEVLHYMTKGLNNSEIGRILHISRHTVKAYVSAIIRKMKSNNRSEATFWAGKHNLF